MLKRIEFETFLTRDAGKTDRQIGLYTGAKGGDLLNEVLAVYFFGLVNDMLHDKLIDKEKANNLKAMLKSEDKDNYEIAVMAINHIRNEHSI